MPKPSGEAPITLEAMLSEIEALKAAHPTCTDVDLTPEQKAALLAGRPGEQGGVAWNKFIDWWKSKGWPGCESTLRKRLRELRAGNG